MRAKLYTLLALATLCPIPASAQDYLSYREEAAFGAMMAHSVGSCGHFGYEAADADIKEFMDDLAVRGVMDGMTKETALQFQVTALQAERERQEFLQENSQDSFDSFERYIEFWRERCTTLSEDPRSSSIFEATGTDKSDEILMKAREAFATLSDN